MSKKLLLVKVFLLEFDDIKAPIGYTKEFFHKLFFNDFPPDKTPDNKAIGTSIFSYFMGISDGRLQVKGEVLDWKKATGYEITKIPHWNEGPMLKNPEISATCEGIIPALCMKAYGYTGNKAKDIYTMTSGEYMGQKADLLVIFPTDFAWGGCARDWGTMKAKYNEVADKEYYKKNFKKLTEIGWDDNWPSSTNTDTALFPAVYWPTHPEMNDDGTINNIPAEKDLTLLDLYVMMHEMGHIVADFPDLYGGGCAPWGVFDLMACSVATHFPMSICSYLRNMFGWLEFDKLERQTHKTHITMPLVTHNRAYAFPCGLDNQSESIIVENREYLEYPKLGMLPIYKGQGLIFYRLDPYQRRRILWTPVQEQVIVRRITSVIRGGFPYDEIWPTGSQKSDIASNQIPSNDNAPLNHHWYALSSRNALQEIWWEFKNISSVDPNEVLNGAKKGMQFDADFKAINLLINYHNAQWTNDEGQDLKVDEWMGTKGLVMMNNKSPLISKGKSYNNVLFLHPSWKTGGWIKGRYSFPLTGKNFRLYAVFALSEEAIGSDGMEFEVVHSTNKVNVKCEKPGDVRIIAMDMLGFTGAFDIYAKASGNAGRDWGYLLEGWLVPLPQIHFDFVQNAPKASWKNGKGEKLTLGPNEDANEKGGAKFFNQRQLFDEIFYCPKLLFTHPEWVTDGEITGEFESITILPNSVFSAQVGLPITRKVYGDAFKISVSFQEEGGKIWDLMKDCGIGMSDPNSADYGKNPAEMNRTAIFEVYLNQIVNKKGKFILKVNAWGSSAQDWVPWTNARIYVL